VYSTPHSLKDEGDDDIAPPCFFKPRMLCCFEHMQFTLPYVTLPTRSASFTPAHSSTNSVCRYKSCAFFYIDIPSSRLFRLFLSIRSYLHFFYFSDDGHHIAKRRTQIGLTVTFIPPILTYFLDRQLIFR